MDAVLLDAPLNAATQVRKNNLQGLVDRADLRLIGSPNFVNKFDVTTTLNLEQHFGVLDQATLSRISLVSRHSETDYPVLEFELGFSLPNADPTKNPPIVSTSLLVQAPFREPALGFAKHPGDPKRELIAIVNAYPIRSAEDRRTLFECKMRLYQRARERH
ncbi:MAG: hypothetical protein ABI627_17365 [Polyangiaceae bacterium]